MGSKGNQLDFYCKEKSNVRARCRTEGRRLGNDGVPNPHIAEKPKTEKLMKV